MSGARTLLLFNLPSIVDERCLFQLFDHRVEQCLFSGFGANRLALVDLRDARFRDSVVRQALAGAHIFQSSSKLTQRLVKRNAKKREREDQTAAKEDDDLTLVELLGRQTEGSGDTETPELGPYSVVRINGLRLGICAAGISVADFAAAGGSLVARGGDHVAERKQAKSAAPRSGAASAATAAPVVIPADPVAAAAALEPVVPVVEFKPDKVRIKFDAGLDGSSSDDDAPPRRTAPAAKALPPPPKAAVVAASSRPKTVAAAVVPVPVVEFKPDKVRLQFDAGLDGSSSDDDAPPRRTAPAAKAPVAAASPRPKTSKADSDDDEPVQNNRARKEARKVAAKKTAVVFKDSDSD